MMKFARQLKIDPGFSPFVFVPLLNLILLVSVIYALTGTLLAGRGVIAVSIPKIFTSDRIGDNLMVTITSEDVIYFDKKICTTTDLARVFRQLGNSSRPILIRVDRRASAGRIFDVWNLCRQAGMERINIAVAKD